MSPPSEPLYLHLELYEENWLILLLLYLLFNYNNYNYKTSNNKAKRSLLTRYSVPSLHFPFSTIS